MTNSGLVNLEKASKLDEPAASTHKLDCVVIGYNEVPFNQYEKFLRNFGEDSEAYRDLRFSFINLAGEKMDYMGLMNHAMSLARDGGVSLAPKDEFKSGDIPNLAAVYLTNFLRNRGQSAEYIKWRSFRDSEDSRYIGVVPRALLIGKANHIVVSADILDHWHPRFDRVGKSLD